MPNKNVSIAQPTRSRPISRHSTQEQLARPRSSKRKRVLGIIPAAFDVRRLVEPGIDKRGRKVGPFEARGDARNESQKRLRSLRAQGGTAAARVVKRLESCAPKRRCGSLACPMCARLRRIDRSASILAFLAQYDPGKLRLVTLINPADSIRAGHLHEFEPKKLITRVRRQLDRLGIDKNEVFLIGGLDGEWDAGWQVYQPHLHLITWGITKADMKRLVARWPKHEQRVRVRKRVEPIDDLPRVATYLDKSFWPSVSRKGNPEHLHPHERRRPPSNIEVEILTWFHRHSANELRFIYGAKSYGRKISKT